jgi:FdhD protein
MHEIVRVEHGKPRTMHDKIIKEVPYALVVNDQEIIKFVCTPEYVKSLSVGYLFSQGLIHDVKKIETIVIEGNVIEMTISQLDLNVNNKTIMSSGERSIAGDDLMDEQVGLEPDNHQITPARIYSLADKLFKNSKLHAATGGVHNGALTAFTGDFYEFRKDVGRHNVADKLIGYCLLNNIPFDDKILVFSGRISSEILKKVIRARLPMMISVAAPTTVAIELAKKYNITLVGFVRGQKMNVYHDPGRINL